MVEELQHLIERIQKEAVDAAEQESARVIALAKDKASAILRAAEDQAKELTAKTEADARAFVERSKMTLEQAARDLLITVGKGVEKILSEAVASAVDQAMTIETLQQMLVKIVEAYVTRDGQESRVDLLVSPRDREQLVRFFADQRRKKLMQGVNLHIDNSVLKGFKVSFVDDHVYHDFTSEAIAEALDNFLRPNLSEIVRRVARGLLETEKGPAR
jgi:V/A-type H+/Na+-transporting ATPase subunit E